jgi:HEAT repeat protein
METNVESPPAATSDQVVEVVQVNPNSSNTAAISEEMRAAAVGKELDAIRELQGEADGENNPIIITALLDKLSNPEAEVRKAALESLRQLNDTNAVPGLEKVAESTKDPREKVAVMDAIEYIKMPSVTENVPPEFATNFPASTSTTTNIQFNPAFLKGNKTPQIRNRRHQAAPPNAPAEQPQ